MSRFRASRSHANNYSLWPEQARPRGRRLSTSVVIGAFAAGIVCAVAADAVMSELVRPGAVHEVGATTAQGTTTRATPAPIGRTWAAYSAAGKAGQETDGETDGKAATPAPATQVAAAKPAPHYDGPPLPRARPAELTLLSITTPEPGTKTAARSEPPVKAEGATAEDLSAGDGQTATTEEKKAEKAEPVKRQRKVKRRTRSQEVALDQDGWVRRYDPQDYYYRNGYGQQVRPRYRRQQQQYPQWGSGYGGGGFFPF